MSDDTEVEDLRHEIESLKEEQRRLREQQHKNGGNGNQQPKEQQKEEPEEQPKPPLRMRFRRFVAQHPAKALAALILVVILIIAGILLWMYFNSYESTDDAQVDGHLNAVSPRISGTILRVYVENNQFVQAGQSLVDLDPRDYEVALARAREAYAQAGAQFRAEDPNVPIVQTANQTAISTGEAEVIVAQKAVAAAGQEQEARQAALREAEAQNVKAQNDVARFAPLAQKEEISRQQFDAVTAAAKTQAAAVDAARASVQVAARALEERRAQLQQAQTRLAESQRNAPYQVAIRKANLDARKAGAGSAKAALDQATLDLAYTHIRAPVGGIVTGRTAEVGQRVQPGEELLSISQTGDIWITANFKETQLMRMRAGQPADVKVDAFGQTFHGYVDSLPGSTGARTSLLPPENATGNYVKVIQRLPVRIRLKPDQDPQHRLRIGMSVEPKVWVER